MTRLRNLLDALRPLAEQVTVLPEYWINGPDGVTYFNGGDHFCWTCGRAVVRHLRRRKPRCEYILDGGWRSEHDNTPFCAGCHARLDGSLTDYGSGQELDHYIENGLTTDVNADALDLYDVLTSLDWQGADPSSVAAACEIAEQLLANIERGDPLTQAAPLTMS